MLPPRPSKLLWDIVPLAFDIPAGGECGRSLIAPGSFGPPKLSNRAMEESRTHHITKRPGAMTSQRRGAAFPFAGVPTCRTTVSPAGRNGEVRLPLLCRGRGWREPRKNMAACCLTGLHADEFKSILGKEALATSPGHLHRKRAAGRKRLG